MSSDLLSSVIHCVCASNCTETDADALIKWLERGKNDGEGQWLSRLMDNHLLTRACVRSLVANGTSLNAESRIDRAIGAVCGAVIGICGVEVGREPLAAGQVDCSSLLSQPGAPFSGLVDSLVSSIFEFLRSLRHKLRDSGLENVERTRCVIGAIHAYVVSEHLSPRGFVEAMRLHPSAALESLLDLIGGGDQSSGSETEQKQSRIDACLSALVDRRWTYCGIAEYDAAVLSKAFVAASKSESPKGQNEEECFLPSPLEASLIAFGYDDIADCHRVLQQLSVSPGLSGDAFMRERITREVANLTSKVLRKKKKAKGQEMAPVEDLVENFEEGELLVSVYKSDADTRRQVKREVAGVVPRRVGCGVVVRGLVPENSGEVSEGLVRNQCDAFAAVKSVEKINEEPGCYAVTMTSMVGAVRCFEAMCTRERRFWGEVGECLVAVPGTALVAVHGYNNLLLEGVESIEQEERVKEMLEEKGLAQPSSWVPVGAGVKGVVLCFANEEDGKKAFHGLGGISEEDAGENSRKREVVEVDGQAGDAQGISGAAKRPRTMPPAPEQNSYEVLRNKQSQGYFKLQVLDNMGPLDFNWPSSLDASQRVDINYLFSSLFPSNPQMRVGALWPAEEKYAAGLRKFDVYLRQKGRAGVVIMDQRSMLYLIPTTAEGCARLGVGNFFGSDPSSAMLCVMIEGQH